ncbi:transketolase [Reticulomyxa filosa]|uniref:Transketolase n=1 Tax=Reticulomyxa filosa TaxID=46433 RepID=X6NJJ5_RETFI|nr:transketolase [Reticulomyxa filosa]|eukprot:ETO26098.1 transketolase [Reticulomyxa filosa]
MYAFRPADGNEIVGTWIITLERLRHSGVVMCLSRQNVDSLDFTSCDDVSLGMYRLTIFDRDSKSSQCPIVLIATGSEVGPTVGAAKILNTEHQLTVHVLSAPCLELFAEQPLEYKRKLLGKGLVISVEAAATSGWHKYSHYQIGIDRFGVSADEKSIKTFFGFTDKLIAATVLKYHNLFQDKPPLLPCLLPGISQS